MFQYLDNFMRVHERFQKSIIQTKIVGARRTKINIDVITVLFFRLFLIFSLVINRAISQIFPLQRGDAKRANN